MACTESKDASPLRASNAEAVKTRAIRGIDHPPHPPTERCSSPDIIANHFIRIRTWPSGIHAPQLGAHVCHCCPDYRR